MEDRVTKETKLMVAKDIVASYVRNNNVNLSPEQLAQVFKDVYRTVDEVSPEAEKRKIGLGV
ncbi:MAG: hypothetical protein SFZ03_08645 [Candidatus Melainabacteria bacterium]|nr:hypothetical protein [Candidatus Melainabacteria bacterium]